MLSEIIEKLPGYNCGNCSYKDCEEFAHALLAKQITLSLCSMLEQEKFFKNKSEILNILSNREANHQDTEAIRGVIDQYEADIILESLPGETSCREVLLPFTNVLLKKGDVVEYRPLGCPVVHYAKIIKTDNLLITVHIIGPCQRMHVKSNYISIGCCMVIAFEGSYYGKNVKLGETIRFLPKHCMMQKVHSGVVVNIEANKILVEGIDLKVWHPALMKG